MLLSLLPGLYIWWWLRSIIPGAGPQGGLFAFMILLSLLIWLTLIGLVFAVRLAGSGPGAGAGRYTFVIGLWLVAWGVMAWKLAGTANTASLADATPDQRNLARRMYVLLLCVTLAAYLWMLLRIREARHP